MIAPSHTAFLIIDMQRGFIDKGSPLCIAGAEATLPACTQALNQARLLGIPVFYIRREYAEDGSNVEAPRFASWKAGGKPLSPACPGSADFPESIAPLPGDCVITKSRYSAFYETGLDAELKAQGINTIVVTGTTTPNCIRATCVDGLSSHFNVALIEECTSSRTPEVQAANLADLAMLGVQILSLPTFMQTALATLRDIEWEHHQAVLEAQKP